jgi:hypothetical protein
MSDALRTLSDAEIHSVAGGFVPDRSDPDNWGSDSWDPNKFTRQLDISNGIVRQWMLEDPAFAAQMHAAEALALQQAAVDTGTAWETFDANGEHRGWGFVAGSEGERLLMEAYAVQGIHVY